MVDHARLALRPRRLAVHPGTGGAIGNQDLGQIVSRPSRSSDMQRRAGLAGKGAMLAPLALAAQTPLRDGSRRLGVLMGNLADSAGRRASICALTGAGP